MKIKMYGADWCSDCVAAKKWLTSKKVIFEYIIITNNNDAINFLEEVSGGKRVVPTFDIDGRIYINPGINGLIKIIT